MRRLLLLSCALLAGALSRADAAEAYSPDAVKAAYVLRFAAYVEWPALPPESRSFVVAVHGDEEMAKQLERASVGRVLLGRPVEVRRIGSPGEAREAQIVFVGPGRRRATGTVRQFGGHGVLLVSDEGGGLGSGASVNLLMADNRVRFEVSLANSRRAGLRIGSELLALAVRVLE